MNKPIENDKIKRKRLKVISACGECRRKKTKCNGEYPCTGCLKARVECKYVINQKPGAPTSVIRERLNNNVHLITQPVRKKSLPEPSPPITNIQSIEERLSAIENILRNLLGSSGRHQHLLDTLDSSSSSSNHSKFYHQPIMDQPYSDSISRDIYPPPLHVPNIQNGSMSREKRKREEEERLQLAPIKTNTTNNIGTPTIRNLLNVDPPPAITPSAFHRLSPTNTTTATITTTNSITVINNENNTMADNK
ncbi:hypothetical protein G6F57_004516 [Rhizopus arrhizus]|uniref:Zn(2)-C6 fungal-type domain-containing protein n=1 Tax=Rhizopus oryzae TaxID=64495 RepID=A0A9P6X912_RHIOR|nr:hypothetical protein G6F23_007892 [Rhizopus arrhizus]KAG1413931.1 hypothetical protein G6F58_007221 [Rhizopus delemar]KAG0760498.1 hypothetical protein G6F24_008269 [Rhizopus arrhizus]KAG0792488.1 hypothetical protein G6F21_004321 [Rhizopus arrhizus]KAG0798443.1 hypothetical protein G6F22_004218 [Rhizopus arrhizus]